MKKTTVFLGFLLALLAHDYYLYQKVHQTIYLEVRNLFAATGAPTAYA